MKKIILTFFFLLLTLSTAFAGGLDWSDIELNEDYYLSQSIKFPGIVEFKKDDKFEVLDIFTGDSNIIYYQMHLINCKEPDLQAEMILINPSPEDRSHDHSVGVELEEGCNLGIWIEASDYYSPSLFLNLSGH